jgi:hypothetical protein
MKIPDHLYVDPDGWKEDGRYDHSRTQVGVQDLTDRTAIARLEEEADKQLARLQRNDSNWQLHIVLRGSVIQDRDTFIVFRRPKRQSS